MNAPSYEQVRDAAYALLVAAGLEPLEVSADVWSQACADARADFAAEQTDAE